jgi:hypothetical protein
MIRLYSDLTEILRNSAFWTVNRQLGSSRALSPATAAMSVRPNDSPQGHRAQYFRFADKPGVCQSGDRSNETDQFMGALCVR